MAEFDSPPPAPAARAGADIPPPAVHAALARAMMRRQARLSVGVAAVFLAMLLGLPAFNALAPRAAATPVWGFPANWLFLALAFYPVTWALSWWFIRGSDRLEAECADWRGLLAKDRGQDARPTHDARPADSAGREGGAE